MKSAEIAEIVAPYLGTEATSLNHQRYSQNFVYSYCDDGCDRILRVTADSHRSRAEISAELDWIGHLHHAGASVCRPVGKAAQILTITRDEETLHAVTFEKAAGRPVHRDDLAPKLYYAHGQTLGTLHRLAAGCPSDWSIRRRHWDDERYFSTDISTYLPADLQKPLSLVFGRLREKVNLAPRTERTFGPVHFDFGYSNFFVEDDRLNVFDFDNCTAAYFIGDIAGALYGSIFTHLRCEFPGDRSAFELPKSTSILEGALPAFREGYASAFEWPSGWQVQLQPWLDIMYFRAVIHAYRLHSPITNPAILAALRADIENILAGSTPVGLPGRVR